MCRWTERGRHAGVILEADGGRRSGFLKKRRDLRGEFDVVFRMMEECRPVSMGG